jgi:hypothetical protein
MNGIVGSKLKSGFDAVKLRFKNQLIPFTFCKKSAKNFIKLLRKK